MKETKHMVAVAEYPAEPAATYGLTYVCKDIEHTSVGFAHACPNTALNKSSQWSVDLFWVHFIMLCHDNDASDVPTMQGWGYIIFCLLQT